MMPKVKISKHNLNLTTDEKLSKLIGNKRTLDEMTDFDILVVAAVVSPKINVDDDKI